MNWNLINQPLGGNARGIQKKEMPLPLAIPITMAAAGLASSFWGAKKSADAAKEAEARLRAQKAETENERRLAKNQSWTDTKSGVNTMRKVQEQSEREREQLEGAAKIAGGTDASVARGKEMINEKEAEVVANAEAAHEARQQAIDAQYRQELNQLNAQQNAVDQQRANATAQAAGAASSALMTGAALTFGGTKAGQEMFKGSPAGGGTTPSETTVKTPVSTTPQTSQLNQMGWNEQMKNDWLNTHQYRRLVTGRRSWDMASDWLRNNMSLFGQ